MQNEYEIIIRREGAYEVTYGSLELYNFNEIICGTLKNSEKETLEVFEIGHFKNVQK
jgi:hypothetical protein